MPGGSQPPRDAYDSEEAADRWAVPGLSPAEADVLSLVPDGARVLDLGGGAGRVAEMLGRRRCRVLGADAAPAMIRASGGIVARAEALPFQADAFDAVVMIRLLHLLPSASRRQALSEALRVLQPGGLLAATVLCPPLVPPLGGAYAPKPVRRAIRGATLAAVVASNALTDLLRGRGRRDMLNGEGERAFFLHFTPREISDALLECGWGALKVTLQPPLPEGWRRRLPFPGLEARTLAVAARKPL